MFRETVLVRALVLAFSATALTGIVVQPVLAQSNAVGTIFGRIDATPGASIVVVNTETNLQRKATPDASGRYTVTALPVGRYKVSVMQGDKVVNSAEVDVLLGQGVDASFTAASVQTVKVTGQRKRIDVSNTNNGAVFSSKELAKLPMRPSVDAIIQLAPNTTKADDRYAGASFGGGGASENAYYINGMPVTNPITGLGSSELPFGAVAQAQILTGGFGAEFGRSIGGVVNLTTKSGTNNWEFGVMGSIEPKSFRSKYKNIDYAKTGAASNAGTDGTLRQLREENERQETRIGAYLGGPLVKDKLFMFVSLEETKTDRNFATYPTSIDDNSQSKWGWTKQTDTIDRYLVKLDWNINDNHRLEFTSVGDDNKTDLNRYSYDFATRQRGSVSNSGEHYRNDPATTQGVGGDFNLLKYVGNFTDNLTLTALYGRSTVDHSNTFDGYDVYDLRSAVPQIISSPSVRAPGLTYTNNQPLAGLIMPKGGRDIVKNARIDLEYKWNAHTFRIGADQVKLNNQNTGFITAGGSIWRYFRQTETGSRALSSSGVAVDVRSLAATNGALAGQGFWVRQQIFSSATPVSSEQTAQFIEDKWQVNKNLLVTLGLRDEQFKNINGDNEVFLDMKNQISPRLGASWDVNSDASLKVYGTVGRYYLQVPSSIGVRGAARSLFTRQAFTYTGIDANGAPTGTMALGTPFSTNNEYNQAKDPKVVSAVDMKPNFQDEMTIGFEKAHSPSLNYGAKVTYRKLKSTLDDLCDGRPFEEYFKRQVSAANPGASAAVLEAKYAELVGDWHFGCATFNPGEDNTFLVDLNENNPALARKNYTTVRLTAADIRMPKAERTYFAMDLFAEHPYRDGWYGKVNYTWSKNKGNTEGQTRSDNGQTNPGATTTWDTRELPEHTNGLLPNDREHQIKAFGFYDLTPEWTIGGNLLIASGRPLSCFGNHPTVPGDFDYGSAYNYCGNPADDTKHTPVPRGSLGRLPTDFNIDMNVVYKPAKVKGLALKVDVFNLFNRQTVIRKNEEYNSGANTINPLYNSVSAYAAPRAFKFTVEYNHKF